jgi:thymidine kinase
MHPQPNPIRKFRHLGVYSLAFAPNSPPFDGIVVVVPRKPMPSPTIAQHRSTVVYSFPSSPSDGQDRMAKLYFRYGTVGSAKTLNLLAVAHSYSQQEKRVIVMKPALDNRFGYGVVRSRAGLERDADILLEPATVLNQADFAGVACVLVDEAQFLSRNVVDQLRALAIDIDVPVICYGLRSDFRTALFEGAQRLFELADEITEIKTTCFFCNRRALFNLKLLNGKPTTDGPSIELGADEKYLPACAACYRESFKDKEDKSS